MTDDISKVVREMREAVQDGEPMKFRYLSQWADRLESATTPAEVDGEAASDDSIIARCEAVGIKWLEPDNVLPDGTIDLEGFPGSFDMATMQEMRALLADYATLARQLAEAKDEASKWKSLSDAAQIGINVQHKREVRLQSQLAEATRRVAEVEGLVGEWREAANGERDYYSDALRAAAAQLEAALQKEPK